MGATSLSMRFQDLSRRLNALNAFVTDLQARTGAGPISWVDVYDVTTQAVSANAAINSARQLPGIGQWVKDDTADPLIDVAAVYTALQTEIVTFRDFVVANKQPALDLGTDGRKIEPALTAGQRTGLGTALTPLNAALEAVPGVV